MGKLFKMNNRATQPVLSCRSCGRETTGLELLIVHLGVLHLQL